MDRVKVTLTKALGEKAASDFIQAALAVQDPQEIKKRVCKLLDTRKQENRHVYEILMKEKSRRDAFPHEGYRKSDTHPNARVNSDIGPVENEASFVEKTKHSEAQNTNKSKRKLKFYPLFSEGARGEELVAHLPGRHPCQCLATKHQLINNCTSCGRIVCTQEGSGPCYFCGHLVCSKEEKQIIGLGTKQALKLQNRLLQVPWAPGTEEPLYRVRKRAAKVAVAAAWKEKELSLDSTNKTSPEVGDYFPGTGDEYVDAADELEAYTLATGAQQRLEEGLAAALANRDRLLEYDASSARRTRVLDDEMDYFVSEGAGGASVWLSPEARDRVQKRVSELRAQRHASRLETMRFCLDFAGREIIAEVI
ncbi:Activating signal cointegrator [Fasciola gigantica]|uniref:Activating signal cointegrator n=1 Tax=Fasciola gigantica TaxID=46835 RepID=A0A504Z5A6_FASGI|nr:Activating signal cointegrator [Fasciola gigantica]